MEIQAWHTMPDAQATMEALYHVRQELTVSGEDCLLRGHQLVILTSLTDRAVQLEHAGPQDDDRLGEHGSRNEQVSDVPESHDQESSLGASRDKALSPARRTVWSWYELRSSPVPSTRLRYYLV
ncbi:hypothetical protein NDU88_002904 [Pleurodeles waltl]|uniref:Uncharacterized protein n=1 Tax=Pleurodeles waltl TaxID=8319 RepID=A0AAV7RCD7_PLEWA|nr:hypothetical protein NDU88_002904 [Pleurodeles waltl]